MFNFSIIVSFLFLILYFAIVSIYIQSPKGLENIFLIGFLIFPFNNFLIIRLGIVDIRLLSVFWLLPIFLNLAELKQLYFKYKFIILSLFIFVGINFLSLIVSNNFDTTFKESIQYIYFSLVFLFTLKVVNNGNILLKIAKIVVIVSIIFSIYGIFEYLTRHALVDQYILDVFNVTIFKNSDVLKKQETLSGLEIIRAESMNWGQVGTAQFLMIFIFISFGFLDYLIKSRQSNLFKRFAVLSLLFSFTLLLLTYSRAAYIVFFLTIIFNIKYLSVLNKRIVFLTISIILVILFFNALFLSRVDEIIKYFRSI